jgi:hypothetical protein
MIEPQWFMKNDFKIYFSETTESFKRLGWSVHCIVLEMFYSKHKLMTIFNKVSMLSKIVKNGHHHRKSYTRSHWNFTRSSQKPQA